MKKVFAIVVLVCQLFHSMELTAQITDRIELGNNASEIAHGLLSYCPDYTRKTTGGLKNATGRNCLVFNNNPFCGSYKGIYGGEYSFVMQVDGTRQNYVTLKCDGSSAVKNYERYWVQADNKDLQWYNRDAVSFDANKANGGFAYSTLIIPRKVTDGKKAVVIRVRSVGHFYAYGSRGQLSTFQYAMEGDMPTLYAVYSSTTPYIQLNDEPEGNVRQYADAPVKQSTMSLAKIKETVQAKLADAMALQCKGADFKPAYSNNNFNIVEAMGQAYQHSNYGNVTAAAMAAKIRAAIDSMVYINNLSRKGQTVTASALGQTRTEQKATSGWGGLYGNQGYGIYLLWKAGKVTNVFLNAQVDLGDGKKSRREQWIEAFKESFEYGCSYTGRRQITNQAMEAAYSVYGAALALYALDPDTYYNAPNLAHRILRESLGLEEWTGAVRNCTFDGSVKDENGRPAYVLGDPASTNLNENFWGNHWHNVTSHGNGREEGWTCSSCYGNMGQRMIDLYIISAWNPHIGEGSGPKAGNGDLDILRVALANEESQSYFTYPFVDANGNREILGESATCWRNRYNPGRPFYGNLIVAYMAEKCGDTMMKKQAERIYGHCYQGWLEGHCAVQNDMSGNLFPYYTHTFFVPDAIDALSSYISSHMSNYSRMPSTSGERDYVFGDAEVGVVAVKHGDSHLFVNFYSEQSLGSSGRAHIITKSADNVIAFVPQVMLYTKSGHTTQVSQSNYISTHNIVYPDNLQLADGGTTYDIPAYDENGSYNESRRICYYYQQQIGKYLVAQNNHTSTLSLIPADDVIGKEAIDVATGEPVTISDNITLQAGDTRVFYMADYDAASEVKKYEKTNVDASELKKRVEDMTAFAQTASSRLSGEKRPDTYQTNAFMPFFKELTMAAFYANSGIVSEEEVDSMSMVLEQAYSTFASTSLTYEPVEVPTGREHLLYTKKIASSGMTVTKNKLSNVTANATLYIPVMAMHEGEYIVRIRAKGHVDDKYKPSITLSTMTPQQYFDKNEPDNGVTQQITYDDENYSVYTWTVHLPANETVVLKYRFTRSGSGYTCDVSYTDIEAVSTGVSVTEHPGICGNVKVFDSFGRMVRGTASMQDALENLMPGIYIINGKKYKR